MGMSEARAGVGVIDNTKKCWHYRQHESTIDPPKPDGFR